MDSKITKRIEEIGSILAIAESAQLPLLESYLEKHHSDSWDLVTLDRGGRGKHEARGSKSQLSKNYKAWLAKYDRAWQHSQKILAHPPTNDWESLSELTGLSPETCRQVSQALQRGIPQPQRSTWF